MSLSRTLAPPFWSTMCSQALATLRGVHHDHHLVVEAVDGAVVDERALARRGSPEYCTSPGVERADVVAGDPVDEGVPVGAGDLELAHVRDVEDARPPVRTAWCSARMPAGYCTGISQPANGTILRAERDVDVVERGALEFGHVPSHGALAHQHRHQRLLHVQPVLGLVPHPRLRPLEHRLGHLFAAVGRQAVEEDRRRVGARHQRARPRCSPGRPCARCSCSASWPIEAQTSVLTTCGAAHRLLGSRGQHDRGALAALPLEDVAVGLVALGTGEPQLEAEHRRRRRSSCSPCCCRRRSRRPRLPAQPPRLSCTVSRSARTWQGWSRSVSPLITGTVAKRASSSTSAWAKVRIMMPSHVAREHARGVADRLAAAELDVARREEQRVAAELGRARPRTTPGSGSSAWRRSSPASCPRAASRGTRPASSGRRGRTAPSSSSRVRSGTARKSRFGMSLPLAGLSEWQGV